MDDLNDAFDATRSTGYLCAANVNNFEQVSMRNCFVYVGGIRSFSGAFRVYD